MSPKFTKKYSCSDWLALETKIGYVFCSEWWHVFPFIKLVGTF